MTVNYEIKSQLAKLLATEDLVVENKNVSTACFDVVNRVLTLPLWKRASDAVYDMLVGHEVGHALHTPTEDWDFSIPKQFVNVTEDVRVEKLMKRRYAGLNKTFYNGYKELSEQDFFCIEGEDISKMNLADRINLYYKIGRFIDIPFTDEELVIRQQVEDAETFVQAVDAARVLYHFCKEAQKTESKKEPEAVTDSQDESNDGEEQQEEQQPSETPQTEEKQDDVEDAQSESNADSKDQPEKEPEVTTDSAFEDGKDSLNSLEGRENIYVEHPDFDFEDVVADVLDVQGVLDTSFNIQKQNDCTIFESVDRWYRDFKKSAQKEVNYLVKEFEMRKSADAYSRSSIAKTGTLDCTKLHTYKYNEDLFKKVSVIPDGKNHGLIFILDWSGSMANIMMDTVKQLYNLIWFCSKVNIPFEVYAFSNYFRTREYDDHHKFVQKNKLYLSQDFCLMNVLSSRAKKPLLEKHMLNFFRVVAGIRHTYYYRTPQEFSLGGTPLYESMISLHKIIPHFQSSNDIQKVQCIILTDGDGHPMPVCLERSDYYGVEVTRPCYGRNVYLRNRKTGYTHYLDQSTSHITTANVFLEDLRKTFPYTNFIGIRISEPRDFGRYINQFGMKTDDEMKRIRKDKSYAITNSKYHALFAIISNSLNNDTAFEVKEDATKAQIKSAFTKSLRSKSLNKKVLSKFVDLIS